MIGALDEYLADINDQAEVMFERLTDEMSKKEGITEQLKQEDLLLWVARMNMVQKMVTEIVFYEVIFA